ncbi:hypothetical protein [Croceicoccus gelatinilyticus]|uniref:hypothetical protein n=1 Tax=Croceicoccus gelatinilyticus TaxID=2835536 RepID=UPI001BCC2166|nr:hypothetical protein [Croceicoccus gelatinilyticus]MBS7671598.1 hypothetical protein [Croceicoccus gelatinilyticus]
MLGMLITVCRIDYLGDETTEPQIDIVEPRISMEDALKQIKADERALVAEDAADYDDEQDAQTILNQIDVMAWPSDTNADGAYVITSAWGGPIVQGGYEFRFVPVSLAESDVPAEPAAKKAA